MLPEKIAAWSIRHRAVTLIGWVALVAVALLSGTLLDGESRRSTDPGESGRAQTALNAQNTFDPLRENVLVEAKEPGSPPFAANEELRRATEDLVTTLTTGGSVADVRSPLADGGAERISADGTAGLVGFSIAGGEKDIRPNFEIATARVAEVAARHPSVRLSQSGDLSLSSVVDKGIREDVKRSELLSLPLTLVILLIVFGALVAASVPLLLAGTSVTATFGFLSVVDDFTPINSATTVITLLIGMAVGVDYSLFFLRRQREERAHGHSIDAATRIAARTSGHVVVVSGLTVVLCVSGLVLTGLDNFTGLAISTAFVVGLAVLGSVTVLPALLSLLGDKVDRGRIPWLGKRRTTAEKSRFWSATARVVTRRPALWGGLGAALLILLTLPALGMRLQDPTPAESLPKSMPTIDAAVRTQEAFPGVVYPATVVLTAQNGGPVDSPALRSAITDLERRIEETSGVLNKPIAVAGVDEAVVVRVPLSGAGRDADSDAALAKLRTEVLPETLGKVDGVEYAVSGRTANARDFADRVIERMPLVFGFVLLAAFVLLLLAFRSVPVAIVSIVLNLLSIGAAYGVLTWIFQDGHFASLLGFTPYGGVVGWLPMFMFVLLLGLSMDYHIFILSRIREHRAEGAIAAIVRGTGTSAGVVSGAAVIMVGVFSVFITLSAIEYKMMGVGMAVAVLIDATLVRGVLLPAFLALLGERAWRRARKSMAPERVPELSSPNA
ncbi:MMPL family transporter [Amycolatopsis keratiniphila]|uniref:MMPL family transporter n=1 Tax=Amycolatopsis keratiniphila TaxID=129921 RepID=UPI0008795416|nr:MMPL family transporter [Amycolatopsis keratiniphila]OLZ54229.1 MMPL domain-containing protein [Amycolatopsis keratiniphila subsp. nogabecina]SDU63407.1 putative drug exporter of the RND superfamily [Amycolatopsis keratiniphila]